MTSDSIPLLEVNALSNDVFLAINRIRHFWRQRANANSTFKEITKIEQYQIITYKIISTITPINEKTLSIDFTLLNTNTPKNHKPINKEKDKQLEKAI